MKEFSKWFTRLAIALVFMLFITSCDNEASISKDSTSPIVESLEMIQKSETATSVVISIAEAIDTGVQYQIHLGDQKDFDLSEASLQAEESYELGEALDGRITITISGLAGSTDYFLKIVAVDESNNPVYYNELKISTADIVIPTATADNITEEGGYEAIISFEATYLDNVAIDLTSIDGSEIVVKDSSDTALTVSFVDYVDNTATYTIAAPDGTVWTGADNGIYTVSLLENKVKDTSGNYVVSATTLLTVTVNITLDTTAPTVSGINVTETAGWMKKYPFSVTYSDDKRGLDYSTIDGTEIISSGTAVIEFVSIDEKTGVANYYLKKADNSAWVDTDNSDYTITTVADKIQDKAGNKTAADLEVIVITMAVETSLTEMVTNLKVYYSFEETYTHGGIITNMASAYGSTVAIGNGNTWDSPTQIDDGLSGKAMDFVNKTNVNMPALDLSGEVTISFFLKLTGDGIGWQRIYTTDDHWNNDKGFSIALVDNSELKFGFPGWTDVSASITKVEDTWQHYAVTYNDAADTVVFYQEGIKIAETNTDLSLGATDTWSALGRALWDADGQSFVQKMDEIAIYGRSLTETEVKALYNFIKFK